MMRASEATFLSTMADWRHAQARAAAELECRRTALRRELTPDEATAMRIALSDPVIVETLRVASWTDVSTTLPAPKRGWPDDIDAETQWRQEQVRWHR
jgi:hypothetical protein